MTKTERIVLFTLAAINFAHIMDVMIMMPLADIFIKLFDITPAQFSYLVSAYAFAAFLSALVSMFILDLFDRKRALLFLFSGFTVGTLLCGFANGYTLLLILRFVTGLFGGIIGALALSIISDLFVYERRGTAIGFLTAGFSAAAALGVPLGLLLANRFGWNAPFFFVAAIGMVILPILIFRFPPMRGHISEKLSQKPKAVISRIATDANQINALLLGFILVLGHFMIIPFIAPYMIRNVGFTQEQITFIYLIGGILTIFSAPLVGRLTDRFTPLPTFTVILFLSFVPVLWITHMKPTLIPIALIGTSLFFVLGSGRMIAPQTMITGAVGPESRGSFMSLKSALQQLAVASASFVSGLVVVMDSDSLSGYNWVGYISCAFCLLALVQARRLRVAAGN